MTTAIAVPTSTCDAVSIAGCHSPTAITASIRAVVTRRTEALRMNAIATARRP